MKPRKKTTVYQEPLLFRVAGEGAVLYPAGHFGNGENQESPATLDGNEDIYDGNEDMYGEQELEPEAFEMSSDFNPDYDDTWLNSIELPELDPTILEDNSRLYRVYDVFIRTPPDPRASTQFYVMLDFRFGDNGEIMVDHSKFAVVALINISFEDGYAPVSTCTCCATNSMLSSYIQGNWSQTTSGPFDSNRLYACKHSEAAIAWVNHKVITDAERPDEHCHTYAEDLSNLLAGQLVNPPEPVTPGDWILTNVHHQYKSGHLKFFLGEFSGINIFCLTQSTSGKKYLYCFLCPRSRACSHISITRGIDEDDEVGDTVPPHANTPAAALPPRMSEIEDTLVSKKRYPFDLENDDPLRKVIFARTFNPLHDWYEAAIPSGVLTAETQYCCDTQCELVKANPQNQFAELFSLHGYAQVQPIMAAHCRICHTRYDFDGRSLGILNYADRYLFTVELILDLLEFKAISGTPTYSYWHARINTMLKSFPKDFSTQWKKSWMNMAGRVNGVMTAYLSLVDYPEKHFQCCEDPEVVCIDGIVLSVESRRINTKTPWVDPHTLRNRFSRKEERSIVSLTATQRETIKTYIRSGLYLEDLEQLAAELGGRIGPFFLYNTIQDASNPQIVQCPPLLKRFYQSLYKAISPACSMAPSGTWDMIFDVVCSMRVPFEYISELTQLSPVLMDVFSYTSTVMNDERKLNACMELLLLVREKAQDCFNPPSALGRTNFTSPTRYVNDGERVAFTSATQEVLETGAFFPGRPYEKIVRDIHFNSETSVCNKVYKKKGRLGAGTLLFWCGIHRKCLGFYIMKSAESCKTVFQILVTRFKIQPRVIIYDNGCNLSEYILNREPGPFKETYILSDGFHWKNHTNCGVSFNSKLYPSLDSVLS